MKKCPKCRTLNPITATECDGCGVIFAHIRNNSSPSLNRDCPFNDHGQVCGKIGSMSDGTKGSGPWYCSDHFWKLKGYPDRKDSREYLSYRERWMKEHDQPYEKAGTDSCGNLRSVAEEASILYQRLRSGELGKRTRQPGDDDEDIAA